VLRAQALIGDSGGGQLERKKPSSSHSNPTNANLNGKSCIKILSFVKSALP